MVGGGCDSGPTCNKLYPRGSQTAMLPSLLVLALKAKGQMDADCSTKTT